jgi:hypothetical protein
MQKADGRAVSKEAADASRRVSQTSRLVKKKVYGLDPRT